ncbi:MAG: Fe(2+)-trafficking protein [Phycisphaerales bacterium]|nr:Fe(2+)-trafficking protein [Phycisphaerales bacterium]
MADNDARIQQFRKMTQADPDNELGHFSLGRACLEAGQHAQAIDSFNRALEINANLSKCYQLLAEAQLQLNHKQPAIETLTKGLLVAHQRGDLLVKNAMIERLENLGADVPALPSRSSNNPIGTGQVQCSRCGQVKSMLSAAPFKHPLGQFIYTHVCYDCWHKWIGMGTKVINEMRLSLNEPKSQQVFDQQMLEFLNLQQAWTEETSKTQ